MRTPMGAVSDEAERYMGEVAAALGAAGYTVTEWFTEGVEVFDDPDHVIRVGLDGPVADLIWDTLRWKIIVYPFPSSTHDDELSRGLSDREDERPRSVVALARPVLDEARRRWGGREVGTWTFFGHWEDGRVVVEYHEEGEAADQRVDNGRWEEGLWTASGSGFTVEQAQAAVVAEYEHDPDDVADLVAHDIAVGLPGFTRVELDPDAERIRREQEALVWSEDVLEAAKGSSEHDRQAIQTAATIIVTALAKAVTKKGTYASPLSLVSTAAADMVDAVHGEGTAALIDSLLSWWLELGEEEKKRSGVSLPS